MNFDMASVGPEDPDTIGRKATGFLCSLVRKYSCWVLNFLGSLTRKLYVSLSNRPMS